MSSWNDIMQILFMCEERDKTDFTLDFLKIDRDLTN